jgi:hypothetical protein
LASVLPDIQGALYSDGGFFSSMKMHCTKILNDNRKAILLFKGVSWLSLVKNLPALLRLVGHHYRKSL